VVQFLDGATLVQATSYTISASAGTGGTISPLGILSILAGSTRTFTLAPSANYQVSSVGGTCGGTFMDNTFVTNTIMSNCTVEANFTPLTIYYTVTASVNGTGGTISPSSVQVPQGKTINFTITAYSGYKINTVVDTCEKSSIVDMSNQVMSTILYGSVGIHGNCSITATFSPK
jgi:hypothetical protein